MHVRPIVFSDVELLLESPERLPDEIMSARRLVTSQDIPLVLCSTRTRAEIEAIQSRFGLRHPFICENGAAVCVPRGYFGRALTNTRAAGDYDVIEFGAPYADVVDTLHRAAARLGIEITGFCGASVEDVGRDCRLTLQQAQLAKLREYGEPFRFVSHEPDQRTRLYRALSACGLGCAAGGRYDYVGAPVDEVIGIRLLCGYYACAGGPVLSVGVGEPVRDSGLLQFVHWPLPLRREGTDWTPPLIMKRPPAEPDHHEPAEAPGWNRLVRRFGRWISGNAPGPPLGHSLTGAI